MIDLCILFMDRMVCWEIYYIIIIIIIIIILYNNTIDLASLTFKELI
jgi:hypothetical protein